MFQEAPVRACEAQGHAVAGVTVHALVGEVQARAVTVEQRPQRVPRKRLAHVRPAPDVEDRSHGTTSYRHGGPEMAPNPSNTWGPPAKPRHPSITFSLGAYGEEADRRRQIGELQRAAGQGLEPVLTRP